MPKTDDPLRFRTPRRGERFRLHREYHNTDPAIDRCVYCQEEDTEYLHERDMCGDLQYCHVCDAEGWYDD